MRSENPFFSFIIPVYNVERFLPECIESILNQSFTDYEILLIDDGSTDNSLEICRYYEKKDERIKALTKPNAGLSHTRNVGLNIATGEYIFFLDSDDHLEKQGTCLGEVHVHLLESSADIFMFDLIRFSVDENDKYCLHDNFFREKVIFIDGVEEIFNKKIYTTSACNKIIKKSLIDIKGLRFLEGVLSEDLSWCAELLKYPFSMQYTNMELYFYRQNRGGSIMSEISKKHIMDIYKQLVIFSSDFKGKSNEYLKNYLSLNYLNCLRLMCIHSEFSLMELVRLMKPMSFYLAGYGNSKIILLNYTSKIMGFKSTIRVLRFYLLNARK
ncbi:glycosyltransferase [Acinetobacter indicus]|uniref:glycosyltransferase n=1 Tax=Acinetobacter indicus TaxID=756892 RepID=UPI000CEBAFD7|nr:glycosyltransferase [Acinetobacter indicus]